MWKVLKVLKTEKARKIIRKAEKDILQARVKAINSILDNIAKQTEECRSQLASIISAQRLRECQGFIDKVGKIRFTKVRKRQLNKYNMLINKKEGNVTRANSNNLASQAGRQASTSLAPGEGSNPSQTGSQAGALLPSKEGSSSSQAIAHLPPGEGSNSPPAGSQAGALLPSREGSNSPPAIAHLPPSEGSNSPPAIAHLPPGEGSNSYPAGSALLPSGEGSSSSPGHCSPSSWGRKQYPPPPLGKVSVLPRQVNQAIKLGQSGKALGSLPGIGHPRLPRRKAVSPRKTTQPLSLVGSPKGLLMKNLTLSGSLTFPTNL